MPRGTKSLSDLTAEGAEVMDAEGKTREAILSNTRPTTPGVDSSRDREKTDVRFHMTTTDRQRFMEKGYTGLDGGRGDIANAWGTELLLRDHEVDQAYSTWDSLQPVKDADGKQLRRAKYGMGVFTISPEEQDEKSTNPRNAALKDFVSESDADARMKHLPMSDGTTRRFDPRVQSETDAILKERDEQMRAALNRSPTGHMAVEDGLEALRRREGLPATEEGCETALWQAQLRTALMSQGRMGQITKLTGDESVTPGEAIRHIAGVLTKGGSGKKAFAFPANPLARK